MDVEDNENRRLIFIIMKGILTPEEKQYLRRTSNYLRSLGMREGLIEIEMENWEDRINDAITFGHLKAYINEMVVSPRGIKGCSCPICERNVQIYRQRVEQEKKSDFIEE